MILSRRLTMVSSAHLVVALVVVTFLDKTDCLSLQRPAQRPPTSSTTGLYLTRGETNGESRRKEVLASLDRRSWISSVVFSPACAAWSTMTVLAPPPPSVEVNLPAIHASKSRPLLPLAHPPFQILGGLT